MEIVTVGVYLRIGERFLFEFGPNPKTGTLAIVRVGGHVDPDETPWECAAREAMEETGLIIEPVPASCTLTWQTEFSPFPWEGDWPRPLLVLPRAGGNQVNVMFLAQATGVPAPLDAKGLLLLTRAEALALNRQPTTLQGFLDAGGQAWMRNPYPADLLLEPALQCQLLARLIEKDIV